MAGLCPYLGLDADRRRTYAAPSPHHRCFAQAGAERIGAKHQAMTCLTTAFRRCPRLVAGAQVETQIQAAGQFPPPGDAHPPEPDPAHGMQPERARRARQTIPYTELRMAPRHSAPLQRSTGTRRLSSMEFVVLGLAVAIVLALAFTAYALVYRLQVGPGLVAPSPVAQLTDSLQTDPPPTLVPTYTPTPVPEPTLASPAPLVASPTPVPEPTLAVPTPIARPMAASPPTRLVIAKIDLDIPVLPVGIKTVQENGKSRALWADVPNAGGFHETSALPGHQGNTVINGHRDIQGSVFRHLDQVAVGDEILLYVGDAAYPYRVTETLVVPEVFASAKQRAENLRLIGSMPDERLTLVTCTPVGLATHRLLVVAQPPGEAAPDMPEAGSGPTP